ncbi:MAG: hypothetical protein KC731_10375 [Myxococcales bacterium]|nr:hypothetical protein [Myxococcales bacterium]
MRLSETVSESRMGRPPKWDEGFLSGLYPLSAATTRRGLIDFAYAVLAIEPMRTVGPTWFCALPNMGDHERHRWHPTIMTKLARLAEDGRGSIGPLIDHDIIASLARELDAAGEMTARDAVAFLETAATKRAMAAIR